MNIQAEAGESTYRLGLRAIDEAKRRNCGIGMTHNDVTVSVYPESHIHDILEKLHYLREYKRATNGR
jgi:hypothetical protein